MAIEDEWDRARKALQKIMNKEINQQKCYTYTRVPKILKEGEYVVHLIAMQGWTAIAE